MEHEIICEEGICFVALCPPFSLNQIMICGSLMNAIYFEMPSTSIILDIEKYCDDIILLNNITIEECKMKVDIISSNSVCLRLYEINSRASEDYVVGFKIRQDNLFKIVKYCLELNKKI
jgi:hypothetical protein